MKTTNTLPWLSSIVGDLARNLAPRVRFQRLLEAVTECFHADAAALLQLDGDELVPRAVRGLSPETLGRRFEVAAQPRLQAILDSYGPVRFPADSNLPDPYDGLVLHDHGGLYVHDCLGITLRLDGKVWGALTLDALEAGRFDQVDLAMLDAFTSVAAAAIRAAEVIRALRTEVQRRQLVQDAWIAPAGEDRLIGESGHFLRMQREATVVSASDLTVLIQGETGVGKELVARLIHRESGRSRKPMVELNCAALPESLAESELFGHLRGAFSGATQDRMGRFELAHQGTLFLDEVGELPLQVQSTLLRALQSGEIQRVGSDHVHRVDVRVIAATNRDLEVEVAAGRFRADLYHRLSVYPIEVPPLRERGEDVVLLAGYFLERSQRKLGVRGAQLDAAAQRWLKQYGWPGNVRELQHAIDRALIKALSEGQPREKIMRLSPRHLGAEALSLPAVTTTPRAAPEPDLEMAEAVDNFKRELIEHRLAVHQGNLAAAGRSLGVDRGNLHRQMKRLGLK